MEPTVDTNACPSSFSFPPFEDFTEIASRIRIIKIIFTCLFTEWGVHGFACITYVAGEEASKGVDVADGYNNSRSGVIWDGRQLNERQEEEERQR